MIVLGDRARFGGQSLGRLLGLDEIMRVGPHGGINAFIRTGREIRMSNVWKYEKLLVLSRRCCQLYLFIRLLKVKAKPKGYIKIDCFLGVVEPGG